MISRVIPGLWVDSGAGRGIIDSQANAYRLCMGRIVDINEIGWKAAPVRENGGRPLRQFKMPRSDVGHFSFGVVRVPSANSPERNGVRAAHACAGMHAKPGAHLRQFKMPRGIAELFSFSLRCHS